MDFSSLCIISLLVVIASKMPNFAFNVPLSFFVIWTWMVNTKQTHNSIGFTISPTIPSQFSLETEIFQHFASLANTCTKWQCCFFSSFSKRKCRFSRRCFWFVVVAVVVSTWFFFFCTPCMCVKSFVSKKKGKQKTLWLSSVLFFFLWVCDWFALAQSNENIVHIHKTLTSHSDRTWNACMCQFESRCVYVRVSVSVCFVRQGDRTTKQWK